jgi:pimeloyl-ACP methyl ester carboxylesterase
MMFGHRQVPTTVIFGISIFSVPVTHEQGRKMTEIRSGIAKANGLELVYEDWGDINHPPIVLIMGLSAQMLLWPDGFCEQLVHQGYRVIRFDNRDIGLSTKIKSKGPHIKDWVLMARAQLGLRTPQVPYSLHDMVSDTIGLMDFLGIRKAHVVGASMGGMIAQLLSARHPDRVISLGIFFSSTNQPLLPPPAPSAILPLMKGPGKQATDEQRLAHSIKLMTTIGSPGYPVPHHEMEAFVRKLFARSYYPAGVKRQMMAVLGTGNIKPYSRRITAPTVVIHGKEDPLLRPACGKAVARAIRDSQLELIPGMGHDIPPQLWPRLIGLLRKNFQRAALASAA